MQNYLDWFILAVVAWGAFTGYRRGLVGSLGGLAAYLLGMGAAFLFSRPVASLLDQYLGLVKGFSSFLASRIAWPQGTEGALLSAGKLSLPPSYQQFLQDYLADLPASLGTGAGDPGQLIALQLAWLVTRVLAALLLFAAVTGLVRLLLDAVSRGVNRSPLGFLNRLGGMGFGLTAKVIILAVVFGLTFSVFGYGITQQLIPAGLKEAMGTSDLLPYLLWVFASVSQGVAGLF